MKQVTMYTYINGRLAELDTLMFRKGVEYAPGDGDGLINFKEAAILQGITDKEALRGMVAKHIVALMDFIKREAVGVAVPQHQWLEKTGDIIIYMLLLECMVIEEKSTPPTQEGS